ncbi:hypothetical protein [Oscillibacter sp.]|uniref:hypothetical protein n=1 Tax=Oscillibacter sp. TaxID=1945593 RepID=UPI0037C5CCC3
MVLEHTGCYYEPVAQLLHDAGIFVSAVNPLLIKEYGNNSLRKVKTDKADRLKLPGMALTTGLIAGTYAYGHDSLPTEKHEPAIRSVFQEQDGAEEGSHCPS